ncbi:MAG: D-alanyl-lipoteichoic acid acyltransferase DltB (MBOAT superfamily) [Polaribacter sp.]|jgi:D-alanyl-lipoteichoic acid acyltransferase DltB (MBOAT superfamily)|tara:strand:+ start:160 stop:1611 length:1452 start_codon:yes stop_codon:yes gene_type:complete
MLFNSLDFAIFLPIIFILYWFVTNKNLKSQNLLIVISSYIFYGWWDWRFLSLILFSTVIDYFIGISLSKEENQNKRKMLLWTSILVNLGFLGFFKYYNFFLDNFVNAFSILGTEVKANSLNIILPIGISFYTFQTLSYSIDVYKRKLEPTKDFISFSAFVSFFPQLVAGPIERAIDLLPQFYTKRNFDYSKAVDGMKQILWGLFKKIVIADNCATYANLVFDNHSHYSGSTLVVGAFFFTFQIYADFSGYSDIAIGISRLFGFNLKQNFAFPYFSRDFPEFWRRWHISLTTYFRDYLFIPLVKLHKGKIWRKLIVNLIVFTLIGLWHGANWNFIVWGLIMASYIIPNQYRKTKVRNIKIVAQGKLLPSLKEFLSMIKTLSMLSFSIIFFRAENISHALDYIYRIFSFSLFSIPRHVFGVNGLLTLVVIVFFMMVEWIGREEQHALASLDIKWKSTYRYLFYYFILFLILFYGGKDQQFIYFQF